jgi:REP element-mobilizing transposase RayT
MGSTYTSLHFHIVFSTKERRGLIATAWRPQLHEYLGGTVRGLGGVAETVGGVDDHVHILASLNARHRLADFLREVKKASSVWSAENHERSFAWQEGYAAFSVSPTQRDVLRRYIANQEEHHRKVSFVDEIKRLLERNGVNYDPKYLL